MLLELLLKLLFKLLLQMLLKLVCKPPEPTKQHGSNCACLEHLWARHGLRDLKTLTTDKTL